MRLGIVVVWAAVAAIACGWLPQLKPSPFAGTQNVTAVLGARAPVSSDAASIQQRLQALRVTATVVPDGDRLRVELVGVRDASVLDAVTQRGVFAIHRVLEEGAAAVAGERSGELCREAGLGRDEPCEVLRLGPVELDNSAIRSVRATTSPYDGMPRVELHFTDAARQAFGALTEDIVGRQLAIVLDDEVMSAPTVMERIGGGRAEISLPNGPSEDMSRRAEALAAVLGTAPLQGQWHLEELR
ncbi:MAG: hypothetical protein KTR31_09630 [Myxococcales bacterium]|nr:hypothetical protein [Myxococcales bacterium]